MFGYLLKDVLEEVGIETKGLCFDQEAKTTLAFVQKKENGDRDFSFYHNPGADMMLAESDLKEEIICDCSIFHFGTLSMTHETVRNATKRAVELAKQSGALISFDPNIRKSLWNSLDDAESQMKYGLCQCYVLKISDDEIQWFTEIEDYKKAAAFISDKYQIPLVFLSMGKNGSMAFCGENKVVCEAYRLDNTIETTGAGDTFMGCVLHHALQYGCRDLSKETLSDILDFANAAAPIITTRKGALRVMPALEDIRGVRE